MAREYRDSGIEWIGQIPKEWKIGKVKNYYSLQTGFTPDTKNELYYDDNGALWVNISDMGDSHYISNTKKRISNYYITKFNPTIVPKGSLLYSFKLSVGTVAIAGEEMYTNEAIAAFLQEDGINLPFLYYSSQVCIIFNANENIYGAKLLNQDLINNATIIFPPLAEQQKIADYLDKVCGEVDEMVALQETMIEELKAYKQSVITEAVTKGLNPNVPMRDSGIDWIGEIPKHWGKNKVCRMFKLIGSGTTPNSSDEEAFGGNINWIQSGDINGGDLIESKNKITDKTLEKYSALTLYNAPFIIVAMYGASVGNISISRIDGCVNQACCVLSDSTVDFNYAFYTIKAAQKYLIYKAVGGGQPNISQFTLKQLWLPEPPISEQRAIASFLDTKCSEIDSLIALKQEKIEELKEYKKSVIYEYVTGKKEVI